MKSNFLYKSENIGIMLNIEESEKKFKNKKEGVK